MVMALFRLAFARRSRLSARIVRRTERYGLCDAERRGMNLKTHRRRRLLGAAFVLLFVSSGGNGTARPTRSQVNVSGTWDAEFSGMVQGAGTSQRDEFVIEVRQDGSNVTGTLLVRGFDMPFTLSGAVQGTTFRYTVKGSLGPTCGVTVEAEATIDAATGHMRGKQTQSTCEGTAVGQITAVRR